MLDVTIYGNCEQAITLCVSFSRTGYNNFDVGGYGPDELDFWEIEDWYGHKKFKLSKTQKELITEKCIEALLEI